MSSVPESFARYPSLSGRVVFVSGGGSGIGAAIVSAFAENGARAAFVDIQDKECFGGRSLTGRAHRIGTPSRCGRDRQGGCGNGDTKPCPNPDKNARRVSAAARPVRARFATAAGSELFILQ